MKIIHFQFCWGESVPKRKIHIQNCLKQMDFETGFGDAKYGLYYSNYEISLATYNDISYIKDTTKKNRHR